MYDSAFIRPARAARVALAVAIAVAGFPASPASAQQLSIGSVVRKIEGPNDQLEITTNTSRILTLEKMIPKVQVNNPELLAVTPLSATEIQISAKKAGVTQVNLWDSDGKLHTVDVYIYGDVRELEHALATQFPNSSIKVYRYSQSLVLTGFIDRPDYVNPIRQLAEDYAPKVINNISVGGVQQVLLKVKIFEVSREKLRRLGSDFAFIGNSGYVGTSVSGLISAVGAAGNPTGLVNSAVGPQFVTDTLGATVEYAITDGNDGLIGFLDALQQRDVAKILAEPNIVAVSGRPALFNEGGEIPIIVPQSLGNVAIEYKPFGTQVDFLPIVLGNGKIRLEVRPRVSDLDFSNAVIINNTQVPALTVRQVDTAVEMNAGQTFAIAGLIQQRTTSVQRGIPLLMDIPVLGVPFRTTQNEVEEIELLILVTPEFVDPMEPGQVPPCGPGMGTVSPTDCDLYIDGAIESTDHCGPCANGDCGRCSKCVSGGFPGPPAQLINGYGGAAYVPASTPMEVVPQATPQEEGAEDGDGTLPSLGAASPPSPHFRAAPSGELVRQQGQPYQPAVSSGGATDLIGPVGYDDP